MKPSSKRRAFALTGYPLGHTMSPPLHQRLFEMAGEGEYQVLEIPPEELSSGWRLLALDGFNVTIPHKLGIIPYLDELSDSARRYGAVNTVKCGENPSVTTPTWTVLSGRWPKPAWN